MITDFGVDFMKNIRETQNNPTLQLWPILSMGRAWRECQVGRLVDRPVNPVPC